MKRTSEDVADGRQLLSDAHGHACALVRAVLCAPGRVLV